MRAFAGLLFALLLGTPGCRVQHHGSPAAVSAAPPSTSVWAVDLVRTTPGMQAEYLRGIAANWAGGRRIAIERGAVRSYRALAGAPGAAHGWDVLLMTEYADSAAFSNREAIFAEIFQMPRYVAGRYSSATPSTEMRSFPASTIAMTLVADNAR